MTIISIIAAVDEANGIGANNQLLTYLPADLKYFKSTTLGKPIIMGRKTYDSIGRPLPQRLNIVISKQLAPRPGITIVSSLENALAICNDAQEVMIIGGAQIYAAAIEYASRLYITKIHHQFNADTFFPIIDFDVWHCTKQLRQQRDEKNQYDMTFCVYERRITSAIRNL